MIKNALDVDVSFFATCRKTRGRKVNLLNDILKSPLLAKQTADAVDAIRAEPDKDKRKDLKEASIPAFTPSGLFTAREAAGLVQHSGLISFDLDGLEDPAEAIRQVSKWENVAYAARSVSGRGVWGLIPILYPERHLGHFLFMEKVFSLMGWTVDTNCKDVTRLRFYSPDEEAHFNPAAVPLRRYYEPGMAAKAQNKPVSGFSVDPAVRDKVEACLGEIEAFMIDLTEGYQNWFKLGCSLANTFGEEGREYFHKVSQFNGDYTAEETDIQFNRCLEHKYDGITISSFLAACREAGITYKTSAAQDFKDVIID